MAKQEVKYIRKRNLILNADGKVHLTHPSISAAKQWSLQEQLRHGGRGAGYIQVDRSLDPKPPKRRDKGDAADKFIAKKIREEQAARVAQNLEHKVKGANTISLKYKTNAQPESLNDVMVEKIRASQGLDQSGRPLRDKR